LYSDSLLVTIAESSIFCQHTEKKTLLPLFYSDTVKTVDMTLLCGEKVLRQAVIWGIPVGESDPKPIKSAI